MSKLLFIHGSTRWEYDTEGKLYTSTIFGEELWEHRYRRYCDRLTVMFRRDRKVYTPEEAAKKFEPFNTEKSDYAVVPDFYRPMRNLFRPALWRQMRETVEAEVKKTDKIILSSPCNIYALTARKYAKKYGKDYMVEGTGFASGVWYYSLMGKMAAPFFECLTKQIFKEAPCAAYVTEHALQRRYPCKGKTLGCSDVVCRAADEELLQKRLEQIASCQGRPIVLGTIGALYMPLKGHRFVIRALAELKKRGIECFEFQAVGAGSGEKWLALAKKLGVADKVHIVGTLPHEQVFPWLDQVDIYVQPSLQEGLCRALVEATSRACPVVSSNAGGNAEIVPERCVFKRKKYKQLADILQRLADPAEMEREARTSYETSQRYDSAILDAKRDAFYMDFMRD